MKILIIGSGCREHALAWKFSLSEKVEKVFIAPGNGGTALENKCENVNLKAADTALPGIQNELVEFAQHEKVHLTVVGPELPLAAGIADRFREAGLALIGPDQKSAQLESSKVYSKEFMNKYGIRTGKCKVFTDYDAAIHYAYNYFKINIPPKRDIAPEDDIAQEGDAVHVEDIAPLVIKADGLAAGKGVVIVHDYTEAENTLASFMKNESLGTAGRSVLLEEFLCGTEVSVLAAVSVRDGKGAILPFVSARDHKRRFEGGQGPNTGGMGAIAPVPDFSHQAQNDFMTAILQPTLQGMIAEGMDYRGFIFFGLMVHKSRCNLLEYNVRLCDPETEAVLPLMDSDIVDLCTAILNRTLDTFTLNWKNGAVCAPVAVAEGYPGTCRKGDPILVNWAALEKSGAKIFYGGISGTATGDAAGGPELFTNGGRVLAVSAHGSDAAKAWKSAYQGLEAVSFSGMSFRRDIGREEVPAAND